MTEPTDSLPSASDQRLISLTIHKACDGVFIVTPELFFGTSYKLKVDQVREFESWYLGLFSDALEKQLSDQEAQSFMKDWPFPDASITKTRILDLIKKTILHIAVSPETKWLIWALIALAAVLMSIIVGAVIFISNDPLIVDQYLRTDFINLLVLTLIGPFILLLLPLTVFMSKRGFTKCTGHPLTVKNLYLYKTGRLSGAD